MASLQVGKNAAKRSKSTIFGYLREQESLLKLSIPSIPPIIAYLCIAYFDNPEFFARAREDCFVISNDKLTVTNIAEIVWRKHCIYLNQWIESTSKLIATWTFKIDEMRDGRYSVSFVIVSKEHDVNRRPRDDPYYGFVDNGSMSTALGINCADKNATFGGGDQIRIKLDLSKATTSIRVNDKNEVISRSKVQISDHIKYKMTVLLTPLNSIVSLKEFTLVSAN